MSFIAKKYRAVTYAADCITFAYSHGYAFHQEKFKAAHTLLETDKITIVVVGEVKRGKSTVLSALVEDDGLFPINQDVTTCIVTTASYAQKERIKVTFFDGTSKEINRNEIKLYADESYNRQNTKSVRLIEVETPNPKLKDGVVFVDTPGIGSLNPLHTAATLDFIPVADVVLFISDAQAPLTESELEFLRGVRKHCNNFIFVLTKTDINAEYESIIKSNTVKISEYAKIERDNIACVPVSAESKLVGFRENDKDLIEASNCAELETAMWDMVEKNREKIILVPPMDTIAAVLKEINEDIALRETGLSNDSIKQESMKQSFKEQAEKINELLNGKHKWDKQIRNSSIDTQNKVQRIINDYRGNSTAALTGMLSRNHPPKPAEILNAIILMTENAREDIMETITSGVFDTLHQIQDETGLSLNNSMKITPVSHVDLPEIEFNKSSAIGTVVTVSTRATMGGVGGATAGTVIGGILGGIAGIFGGPAGIVLGAQSGATVGAAVCAALGAGWGGVKGIETVKKENIPLVQSHVSNYINTCANAWAADNREYVTISFNRLSENLSDGLVLLKKELEDKAGQLTELIKQSDGDRKKSALKLTAIKKEFEKLVTRYRDVLAEG
jgi:GTPase Era involved in 16S rRNA processing